MCCCNGVYSQMSICDGVNKRNRNTTRRMNGIERPTSMTRFKTKLAILFLNNPPGRVSLTSVPRGKAKIQEIIKETNNMYKVSNVASNISFISFARKKHPSWMPFIKTLSLFHYFLEPKHAIHSIGHVFVF